MSPLLKIWDAEKMDEKLGMGTPVLLRSVKVKMGNCLRPVSLFSVVLSNHNSNVTGLVNSISDTLSHLAMGLVDGTVLLYRYLDQSVFSSSTLPL